MTTESLVQRANRGDVDAFTDLVTRYQGMAFAYALTTLGDYQLAEDATQQALMTAYRNLASLREPGRFGGWLRGIVRFESLRILRERTRHRSASLDVPEAFETADPAVNVERQAEVRGEIQGLLSQMERLPEAQRVVAQLYYLGDQSQAAVAEFLGLSVSTVNNRLRKARATLRREGVYPVSTQPLSTPSFSDAIGKVIRAQEQTIDAHIDKGSRPPLLTTVTIGVKERAITAFISQYLDDDVARLVVTDGSLSEATASGSSVHSQGKMTDTLITDNTIRELVEQSRVAREETMIPTGIKVMDLFAPLANGGVVALVGEKNVGKLVVVRDLALRLVESTHQTTILVFLTSPDELGVAYELDLKIDGPVTAMMVPVADASHEALASSLDRVDTVISMSGELGRLGRYPAIDPLLSRSLVGAESAIVSSARALLQDDPDSDRAQLLRAYLTQPFYIAEPYSGNPGLTVTPEQAEADLVRILEGDVEGLSHDILLMGGSLDSAE